MFVEEMKQIEGKAIPVQAWRDTEVSRSFRLPVFMTVGT
jgi:hypothetical protein